jgi:hypothetical protein
MDEQVGVRALVESVRENAPQIRETMRELPGVVRPITEQAAKDQLSFQVQSFELEQMNRRIARHERQRFWLGLGFTYFVSGVLILCLEAAPWAGWGLLAVGVTSPWSGNPRAGQ